MQCNRIYVCDSDLNWFSVKGALVRFCTSRLQLLMILRNEARLSRSGPGFDPRSGQVSWVRFFRGFSSPVRQMSESFRPQGPRISFGHHYHHQSSFITGANDLRCWCTLKPQIYIHRISTQDLLNRSPVCYHCATLLGGAVFVLWNNIITNYYHHVKDFATIVLKREISSLIWLMLTQFLFAF